MIFHYFKNRPPLLVRFKGGHSHRRVILMASNVRLTKVTPITRSMATLPTNASVGRRWKFRRNLVIYIASQNGVSQRMLADVFDLPHSRIAAIIRELRTQYSQ